MNRKARRAAGDVTIKVKIDAAISVVPMEHVESYFNHEVAREGDLRRSAVPIVVVQPRSESGRADDDWFPRLLAQMRQARCDHGTIPVNINGMEIDIGLIDMQVSFHAPAEKLVRMRDEDKQQMTVENFRHFDQLCAGAFNDQMVMATATHAYRPDGSHLFHYHNLIFGLRKEIRDGREIVDPIDLEPLLKVLGTGRNIAFIGGIKH